MSDQPLPHAAEAALPTETGSACMATPRDVLMRELMDSRVPKTEREHFAAREIKRLQDWLSYIAKMPEYDQDDAYRLRNLAANALVPNLELEPQPNAQLRDAAQ